MQLFRGFCTKVLRCVAVCCSMLQCSPWGLHESVQVYCSMVQCVAVFFWVVARKCHGVMQYVAVCCIVLQCFSWFLHESVKVCCSVWQYIAVCRSVFRGFCTKVLRRFTTLQHTAAHVGRVAV